MERRDTQTVSDRRTAVPHAPASPRADAHGAATPHWGSAPVAERSHARVPETAPRRCLSAAIRAAVSSDDDAVGRLADAGISIRFGASCDLADSVTVMLGGDLPELIDDVEPDVTVTLGPQHLASFARGEIALSLCLLDGDATSTGPIRRYLEVDPILRRLLATASAGLA